MDRNTVVDSIYERYMEDDRGHGRESSAPSITTTEHLSLAPPMPRLNLQNNGRNNVRSTADTASVYTTATTPYERWSLEQGLDARQSAFNPALSTQRPPESPSLSALRKMGSKDQLPRLNVTDLDPNGPYSPSVGASPVPSQQPRRHFSRPL